MLNVEKHMARLGLKVRDRVTGMEGVITSVSFDLYGCIQAVLHPGLDKEGKLRDPLWFDVTRLETLDPTPVMSIPDFGTGPVSEGLKGPAEKPAFT